MEKETNMEDEKYATHLEVRQELMNMQKLGGAMINPFVLNNLLEITLTDEEKQNPTYKNRLRAYSYTFCAIANEFYLFYCKERNAQKEFYILEDRWKKYYISDTVRENAITFLQKCQLISCGTIVIPPENITTRTYKINLKMLTIYRKAAEELYEKERRKKSLF